MEFFIYEARRADIIVINHKNRIIKTPKGWHYYLRYYILHTLIDIEPKNSFAKKQNISRS